MSVLAVIIPLYLLAEICQNLVQFSSVYTLVILLVFKIPMREL